MVRILATDGMEKSAAVKLQSKGFEVVEHFYEPDALKEEIKNYDVVVVRSATKIRQPIIDAALETGRLKLVIRGGVGVDNIDVEYAKSKGIAVTNTPNASSASVAELAIAHMFCLARYIHIANHTMREGKWNKKQYEGIELAGKTLGLIGFGRIARETAKRAYALGMKVVYTNTSGPKEGFDNYKYMPMDELLAAADFISIHIPGSKDKKPVIGEAQFAKMKKGVYIVNTARGGVVSEEALLAALDSGKVAAAALDVFEEEPTKNERIYTHEKISLTPHIGGSTIEAQERIGEEVVQIILNHFE
ncbi:MAG: D-2-hydroxyacid dehydrogenase [Caulobacteraceae bacterium]